MQSNYVRALLSLVHSHNVSNQQLLADTGISPACLQGELELPEADFFLLCERALLLTGEPALGLHLGERLNISTHGVFGYALMSSATIGDVLKLLLQYHRMLVPSMRLSLKQHKHQVSLVCQAVNVPEPLHRFMVEVFYAAVVTSGRFLLGEATTGVELELDYPEPGYGASYQEVFGFPVSFSSPYCQMSFQTEGLALPLATANPAVASIFQDQCTSLLNSLGRQAPLSGRVQQILLFRSGDFPAIKDVARQLFMSERSLRRRLADEGKGFQQLLDQVRFQLSKEYLTHTSLPISEVARLVGFSDSTNFRRSFKRWCGTLPSAFR